MGLSTQDSNNSNAINQLLDWIINVGINGCEVLPSAKNVAQEHLSSCGNDKEKAIDSIIAWRTAYAAGTGFVTGLGGLTTLPITIPASLASSYALAANTAAAIAVVRGYNIESDQVRTFVILALLGDSTLEVLKTVGGNLGTKVTKSLISQIPGKVLIEINKKVGFRLITKAGEKGVVNLMKLVPIVGGVVGAGFDSTFVNKCGQSAKNLFT
ncbi:EcsC family protein [Nostoc sp. FACHB-280]|uniref:EcsC family protein n=1 Tax=Nostoc sp. FACHB-280 TaxID=2692839 RepID=UPI00168B4414|nr:EcsC family protein [Nostoc sp. FACHB-280]MBD2493668.1 EcsC family protein [Nostoc sp. FACHB-280]